MYREKSFVGLIAMLALSAPAFAEQSYEIDVSSDAAVRDGEPSLGANPTNSSNLVVTYLKSFPESANVSEGGQCAVATSFDGGVTWQNQLLPLTDALYSICADPSLIFTAGGTVYLSAIAFNATFQIGHTVVIRSDDGGKTWSAPVEAIGPSSLPAGVDQDYTVSLEGFDRPWLAFDDATGTLYLTTMTIFSRPMGPLAHRYLVTSHDGGKSWGRAVIVDSADYPADHWATGTIAVAPDGTVAITYTARKVPEQNLTCPCAVMATTTDGNTFSRHTVPFTDPLFGINLPEQGEPSALNLVYGATVAADPTRPGRYAVTAAVWKGIASYLVGQLPAGAANRVRVELFVTNDAGLHWTGPVVLGEDPAKDREHVWLTYSPAGVLGVIWRTHLGACCFGSTDTWAVISADGGTTFAPPQTLSHASSPFTKGLGDDYQSVAVDGSFLHAMWSDGRSGNEEIYYGRLSLAGF